MYPMDPYGTIFLIVNNSPTKKQPTNQPTNRTSQNDNNTASKVS